VFAVRLAAVDGNEATIEIDVYTSPTHPDLLSTKP
jgi:hypothetical protein